MTVRFLLDTNVVSSPVARVPDPRIVAQLESQSNLCAIPAPVWHELNFGCARLPRGRRRKALEAYIGDVIAASFPVLAYDEVAAGWHARERARLEATGKVQPFVDGQIAAIAKVRGLVLVTRNEKDFKAYKDLDVVDWSRAGPRRKR